MAENTQQVIAVISEGSNSFQLTIKDIVIHGKAYTIEINHGSHKNEYGIDGYGTDLSFINYDDEPITGVKSALSSRHLI